MSEAEEGSSKFENSENECGVILGYWDHEKTPTLIQDLEHSVGLIEEKCKELLKELANYKKHLQESVEFDCPFVGFKNKGDVRRLTFCGSEPDVMLRSNLIDFQQVQFFEEKFQRQLTDINNRLAEVAHKIGLKNNILLFPSDSYLKILDAQIAVEKLKCDSRDEFNKRNFIRENTKSDSMVIYHAGEVEFSKITKNELHLYQKLSRLNMNGKRRKKVRKVKMTPAKTVQIKFTVRWRNLGFRQAHLASKCKRKKPKTRRSKFKKREKLVTAQSRLKVETDVEKICKKLYESIGKKKELKTDTGQPEVESVGTRRPGGASEADAIGKGEDVNQKVDQLVRLMKRKSDSKEFASEQGHGETGDLVSSETAINAEKRHSILRPSSCKHDADGHSKRRRNALKRRNSTNFRKSKDDCTESLPEVFLEFLKSAKNHSINGEKSAIKARSMELCGVDSKTEVFDCQKTEVLAAHEDEDSSENASGVHWCNTGFTVFTFESSVESRDVWTCTERKIVRLQPQTLHCDEDNFHTNRKCDALGCLCLGCRTLVGAFSTFPSAMLEVMNAGSAELPRTGCDPSILLNCWEKSSPLIKELERTVNFAERKCGDLMQQLHFYKEYYEKWAQLGRLSQLNHKKKVKKSYSQHSGQGSSSENEFEKANDYLYKKIKSKINEMNNEITFANRKIHTRGEKSNNNDPAEFGAIENSEEPQDLLSLAIENKTCKSEPMMTPCDVSNVDSEGINVTGKQSSKSVPVRNGGVKNPKSEWGSSKRRFSSLQRYKIRSKSLPQGVRRKFGFGAFFEVFEPDSVFRETIKRGSKSRTSLNGESSKTHKSRKTKAKPSETRRLSPKSSRNRLVKSRSYIRRCFKSDTEGKKNESALATTSASQGPPPKEVNTCKAVVPSNGVPGIPDAAKEEISLNDSLRSLVANPNSLLPFLRHPIPFVPCSSTSKSFNLGLNVQQVLSLIKRKKHSAALQAIVRNDMRAARSATEQTLNTLFIGQPTASHSHVTSSICPARDSSEDGFSIATDHGSKCGLLKRVQSMRTRALGPRTEPIVEIYKPERPEDVWVVDQPDPASREIGSSQSRCTCFPSKHCVDYNKVLRQYTCWRPAPDTRSSGPPRSKSKFCDSPRESPDFGGTDSDGRTDLMKVHSDLLNLTRKYSSLQEQISHNSFDDYEAYAELDAMESELALREVEFKDILNFYNQLIVLKEKLKSLRTRIGQSRPDARQPGGQRPRKDPLRPTPSMALAKVLKKIQGLQDKIKLIDVP